MASNYNHITCFACVSSTKNGIDKKRAQRFLSEKYHINVWCCAYCTIHRPHSVATVSETEFCNVIFEPFHRYCYTVFGFEWKKSQWKIADIAIFSRLFLMHDSLAFEPFNPDPCLVHTARQYSFFGK